MVKKLLWLVIWWVFWSFVYSRLFTAAAKAAGPSDVIIRAMFPNPVGSDTGEWILLENQSTASVSGTLLRLGDTFGSTKEYAIPGYLSVGELRFVSASQSGIVLNNDTDALVLKYSGSIAQQTEAYKSLGEGMVWWLSADGEWDLESVEDFMTRLSSRNWTRTLEESESRENDENLPENDTISTVFTSKNDENVPQYSEKNANPNNLAQNEKKRNTLINRDNFKIPNVWQTMTYSANLGNQLPIAYPNTDFTSEKTVFEQWKRQALLGTLLISGGGWALLLLVSPQLWRLYQTLRMDW